MDTIRNLPSQYRVKVRCTATRSVPALNIIAKVGERRIVTKEEALTLVSTGCFEITQVIEPEAEQVETEQPEAVQSDRMQSGAKTGEAEPGPQADDLTQLKGVGVKTQSKLNEAGVFTLAQLVESDPIALAEAIGVSQDEVIGWQAEAEGLAEKDGE